MAYQQKINVNCPPENTVYPPRTTYSQASVLYSSQNTAYPPPPIQASPLSVLKSTAYSPQTTHRQAPIPYASQSTAYYPQTTYPSTTYTLRPTQNPVQTSRQNIAYRLQTTNPQRPTALSTHGTTAYYAQQARTGLSRQRSPTVIFVMGETGVGKSTFIRYATGRDVETDRNYQSCTQQVQLYEIPQTNIYLADSPGFGDTYLSGASILAELDEALAELFHDQDVKLAGVLFLHSMTDAKIKGPARINLILLRKLVGSMNLDKCHLVLTKKSLAHRSPEDALEELCEEGGFWEPLVDDGATPALFADSRDSALKIIEPLLKDSNVVLKLTRETQIEERDLKDTKAGRLVSKEICQKRKDMQRDMKHMRDEEQRAMRRNDQESARLYYEAQVEASSNIANLNREGAKLRTRAEASSWLKLRWSGRVCAGVAAGCAIIASNGTLTPLVTSLHSAAEKKIQTWR